MSSSKPQHVHKLKRLKYKSGNTIFFCTLPDCTFKINSSLALGKRSICWRCEEPFIMTEYTLRLAKPHCENCHKPKGMTNIEFHEVVVAPDKAFTLAERLEQTIKQRQTEVEDEI